MSIHSLLRQGTAIAFWVVSLSVTADDSTMVVMRNNLRNYITLGATDYDMSNPYISRYLSDLQTTAQYLRQTMRHDTTFLWPEDNMLSGVKSYTPAHICDSYARLLTMTRAYAYPGTRHFSDSLLLSDIRFGLDFLYRNAYSEHTRIIGNWWEWRIGIPWHYANIVSIVYDHLTENEISAFERSTASFVRTFMRTGDLTYANTASLCRNMLAIGILSGKENDILAAMKYCIPAFYDRTTPTQRFAAIRRQDAAIRRQRPYPSSSYLKNKEGLYEDGTFIQHSSIPYIGTYGTEIIAMAGYMALVLNGTDIVVPEEISSTLPIWISNAYLPAMYRGEMMLMFMGRANDSDPYNGARTAALSIMDAALLIPDSVERANAIRSAADIIMHDPHHASPYDNLNPLPVYIHAIREAERRAGEAGVDRPFSRVLAAGDKVVHQTDQWRFCVSMSSNRIGKYECFMREASGNQNATGWYTSDGMTYLYLPSDPDQYYQYVKNINPYRIPGTTTDVVERHEVPSEQPLFGHSAASADESRAGGVTMDGEYSSAMMQLVGGVSDLRAKKSWFMFDNEIVCLGSDIHMSELREVITTIENRRNVSGPAALSSDGTYAHLNGVGGYWFPDTMRVETQRTQNGCSELWTSHGLKPSNGQYAYVILPAFSSAETAAYVEQPETVILSNNSEVQAVRETRLGITAVHFWKAAKVQIADSVTLSSSGMAAIMLHETRLTTEIWISDPSWDQNKQIITLTGDYVLGAETDMKNVSIHSLKGQTILEIKQSGTMGMSRKISLTKL